MTAVSAPVLDDLVAVLSDRTDPGDYPHAAAVEQEVFVYDADPALRRPPPRESAELVRALGGRPGPGRRAAAPSRPGGGGPGHRGVRRADRRAARHRYCRRDHFAPPGANDRVWNALEKLAVRAPGCSSTTTPTTSSRSCRRPGSGPGYQVTSQVNVVNPGGAGAGRAPRLPPRASCRTRRSRSTRRTCTGSPRCSPCRARSRTRDMPVESGPTLYLPHSQKYGPATSPGAAGVRRVLRARTTCSSRCATGDAAFFNPAVIHGAAPTARPTSAGWPTCCRSPRRSGGRWSRSTGPGSAGPSTRRCGAAPRAPTTAR